MTSKSSRWDEVDELRRKIYESREGRLRVIAHIIKEYLQVKEIKSDPKEFRKFVLENYEAFIYYDNKDSEFYIKKITDEILTVLIKKEGW